MTDIGMDPVSDDLPARPTVISGRDLAVQRCRNELQLIRGEWFLDTSRGLPLVEWITTKGLDTDAVLATLELALREIPDIVTTRNGQAVFTGSSLRVQIDVVFRGSDTAQLVVATGPQAVERNGTPFAVFFRSGAIPNGPAVS